MLVVKPLFLWKKHKLHLKNFKNGMEGIELDKVKNPYNYLIDEKVKRK